MSVHHAQFTKFSFKNVEVDLDIIKYFFFFIMNYVPIINVISYYLFLLKY